MLAKGPQLRPRPARIVGIDHDHRVAVDQVLFEIDAQLFCRTLAQWFDQGRAVADGLTNLGCYFVMPRLGV